MKCPNCNNQYELYYKDSNNNHPNDSDVYHCKNNQCPAYKETRHQGYLEIRHNWWFSPYYSIPFKHFNNWYVLSGPSYIEDNVFYPLTHGKSDKSFTTLQSVKLGREFYTFTNTPFEYPIVSDILDYFPYYALPVNDDFSHQFNILKHHPIVDRYINKAVILE